MATDGELECDKRFREFHDREKDGRHGSIVTDAFEEDARITENKDSREVWIMGITKTTSEE